MKLKATAVISGITAAVLTVSTAAFAAATNPRREKRDARIAQYKLDAEAQRAKDGLTGFEEALMRGESPCDPRGFDYDELTASGKTIHFDVTPVSAESYRLNRIHGLEEGYILYAGSFRVPSVSQFNYTFTDTGSFDCTCDGTTGEMSKIAAYTQNYAQIIMTLTYLKDGEISTVTSSARGNAEPLTLNAKTGKGELVEAKYYFYLNSGSGENAALYEVAYVDIVDDNYIATGLYDKHLTPVSTEFYDFGEA